MFNICTGTTGWLTESASTRPVLPLGNDKPATLKHVVDQSKVDQISKANPWLGVF